MVQNFSNFDLNNIITPIKVEQLEKLLRETNYDEEKTDYLVNGFKNGFDIGYRGPTDRQDTSDNIPLRVGTKVDFWNKIMKEVRLLRYAGPFEVIPYENYMQSPVGLVPKDQGRQTRLIFHLSYNFKSGGMSLNHHTPKEWCRVSYNDIDHAMHNCIELLKSVNSKVKIIYFAKTDARSAFRLVPLLPVQFR